MTKRKVLKLVHSDDSYIAPADLHHALPVTTVREMTFNTEKAMRRYRALVYSINKQGEFRYRTLRSEAAHWSLAIWRMH